MIHSQGILFVLKFSNKIVHNVSICVRAGLSKPRPVPDTERIKDTKTLDYASTPLDANTLLWPVGFHPCTSYGSYFFSVDLEVGQLSTVTCRQMVRCHLDRCRILVCVRLGLQLAFHMPKRNLSVEA